MPDYKIGEGKKEEGLTYSDEEFKYVNKKYILEFFHIPTGKKVQFKSILTQFIDRFESSWNSEDVYGRMDSIETFQSTKRIITLGWDIPAASEEEAVENMKRVSLLIKMLYPVYGQEESNASSITTAPLFKLSFANLVQNLSAGGNDNGKINPIGIQDRSAALSSDSSINGLVGRVSGFSFDPVLEDGWFDHIGGKLYAKTMRLSCDYIVLHTHTVGWNSDGKFKTKNFPYGEDELQGEELREIRNSSRELGNDQQIEANLNKIFGG